MRRQSGAAESNLSDGGYQQRLPGIWTPASSRAAATALSPDRKAWFGTGESPHPKRRRASSPWPTPRLPRVPRIPVGIGVKLPPHSKMSGVSFHHRGQSGIHKEPCWIAGRCGLLAALRAQEPSFLVPPLRPQRLCGSWPRRCFTSRVVPLDMPLDL